MPYKDLEKRKEYKMLHRKLHPEIYINSSKKFKLAHPEAFKKYYLNLKNNPISLERKRELGRIYQAQYRKKYPEFNKMKQRRFHATPKGYYKALKRHAIRKKHYFLSQEEFLKWHKEQEKKCYYCDLPETKLHILPLKDKRCLHRLSIDRKDNDKGYIIENMVLACSFCNKLKSDLLTEQEMLIIGKGLIKKKWNIHL